MTKKIIIFILLITFFLVTGPVFAYTQSEIIQRVDSDINVANELLTDLDAVQNNPEQIPSVLVRDIPTITQHWNESSNFYESEISTETDEQLKTIIININTDIKSLSVDLTSIKSAVMAENNDNYLSSLDRYDKHTESLNSHITDLNNHFGVVDYSWLSWPFWIALVISIVLFFMSRGNPVLPAEQLRNRFEFALFKSSLWPLGGSAISYFWFLLTPPGGTFYVLYGPIGIGYFQFFRGLYSYIMLARPAINLAKKEEKAKLESLIRSDKFQEESMEEQVKEIEKRSGIIKIGKDEAEEKISKKNRDTENEKNCDGCGIKNKSDSIFCKSCGIKL